MPNRSRKRPRDVNEPAAQIVDEATSDEPRPHPDAGKDPAALMRNARRVVSRSEILANVWRKPFREPALVERYVGYLRRKLDALGPPLLYTVRGVGYVLRSPTGR